MDRRRTHTGTLAWLGLPLAASIAVFAAYLWTHPYPATGGGLFLAMAEAVREAGYRLPARIPRYTRDGLPFAYPPLAFYAAAVVRDAFGVGALALTRYAPGLLTVAYPVPVYVFGRALFEDAPDRNRRAGLAALVVAVSPAVFKWHLSAGGIVRAPAYLFTVAGLYVGVRLFRERDRVWAAPGAVLFGLTLLTHPSYPVFFATSYLVFYGYFDRSSVGLARGAVVAAGGALLAAPWWGSVVAVHGVEVFTRTAGSRLGIGQGYRWFVSKFLYAHRTRFLTVWHVLSLAGVVHLLARRRYLLPAWFGATVVVFPKPRFLVLVGAFLTAAVVFDWLERPSGDERTARDREPTDRRLTLLVVALLVGFGVVTGGLYAANYEPIPERPLDRLQQEPLPSYVDGDDLAAMRWARERTAADATFLVAGDAAEWFPVFARRTVVASPWGSEWLPPDERDRQVARYREIAVCASATCIERTLARDDVSPEYVYLSREGSRSWIARDTLSRAEWAALLERINASDDAGVAYVNRDVAILDVERADAPKVERRDASGRVNATPGRASAFATPVPRERWRPDGPKG